MEGNIHNMKAFVLRTAVALGILLPVGVFAITISTTTQVRGNLTVTGALSKGSGSFVIDHPLDPKGKLLYHSFVESPDMKNLYDGITTLDGNGEAVVELPSYFEALNKDFRYQFFPIRSPMPGLYIKSGVKNNRFTVAGGEPGMEISWQVTGIRRDPYAETYQIVPEIVKGPNQLVDKGTYLFPELYEGR